LHVVRGKHADSTIDLTFPPRQRRVEQLDNVAFFERQIALLSQAANNVNHTTTIG
jgi:hypothetical protein